MNNYIVKSYRIVIVVTNSVTKRTFKENAIVMNGCNKNINKHKNSKNKINKLTMDQLVIVIIANDKVHKAPQRALDYSPSLGE